MAGSKKGKSCLLSKKFALLTYYYRERHTWRCAHCYIWGTAVWAVRDGPRGPRTLCHNCGYLYERDKKLPPWSENLFFHDRPHHEVPQYRAQR